MKIDLNAASLKELESLPGIGPKAAEAIVANRPYESPEALLGVPGFGPATLDRIRALVIVRGSSSNGDELPPTLRPDVVQLRIQQGDDGPTLVWVRPDGRDDGVGFDEPYQEDRSAVLEALSASVTPGGHDPTVQAIVGGALHMALLGDTGLQSALRTAGARARERGQAPTVQLLVEPDAIGSAQLPWELVHDGDRHLLAVEALRLNRHVMYFGDRSDLEPVDRLRILYASSRPTDAGPLPAWESEQMRSGLGPLIDAGYVQVTFLTHATFAQFAELLRVADFDVAHFDGHGGFDRDAGGGLWFEKPEGTKDFVRADRIAEAVVGSSVRLVVLGACEGSAVGGASIFNSTAPALIRAGVPSVVGNQFSVWTDAMEAFNRGFYSSLARGESISAAVADARTEMRDTRGQFFLPTLYLRVADGEGYLFRGEPEEHRRWREQQTQQAAARYWQMPEQDRQRYPEGPPTINGVPVVLWKAYFWMWAAQQQAAYLAYLASIDPQVWQTASPEVQQQVDQYQQTQPINREGRSSPPESREQVPRNDRQGERDTGPHEPGRERDDESGRDRNRTPEEKERKGKTCAEERRKLRKLLQQAKVRAQGALDAIAADAPRHHLQLGQTPVFEELRNWPGVLNSIEQQADFLAKPDLIPAGWQAFVDGAEYWKNELAIHRLGHQLGGMATPQGAGCPECVQAERNVQEMGHPRVPLSRVPLFVSPLGGPPEWRLQAWQAVGLYIQAREIPEQVGHDIVEWVNTHSEQLRRLDSALRAAEDSLEDLDDLPCKEVRKRLESLQNSTNRASPRNGRPPTPNPRVDHVDQ